MKTRKTTIILLLLGMLFTLPIEQAIADELKITVGRRKTSVARVFMNVSSLSSETTAESTVKVTLAPSSKESPKPVTSNFNLNITSKDDKGNFLSERDFTCIKDDCLFSKKDNPIGKKYKITLVVLDKNGKPISKTVTQEITVEEDKANTQAKVTSLKLRRRGRKGSAFYHIVAAGIAPVNSDSIVIKVSIAPSSKESPEPKIKTFLIRITSIDENGNYNAEKNFACIKDDCLFGDDAAEIGDKYKITTVVLNKDYEAISKTKTKEVTVKLGEECKVKYSLGDLSLTGFDFYAPYSEKNNSEFPLLIKRKGSKGGSYRIPAYHRVGDLCILSGTVRTSSWSTSNSETNTIVNAVYDEKSHTLTGDLPDMDSVFIKSFTTTSTVCGYTYKTHEVNFNKIESVQGDEIEFRLRKTKETSCNDKDSTCTAPLTLSEDITLKSSISGSFQTIAIDGVSVTQKDKALSDLEVEAIVEMKSCKEASIYVAIPLKYNDKTGTYANSKALALCNKAGMTVLSMDVVAKGKGLPLYKWTHVAFTHSK